MTQRQTFAETLKQFIHQDGRRVRQLSQVTADLFGSNHQVPHNTISRWLRGEVRKPRNWPDIVKLGAALQLSEENLFLLLQTAGHDGPILLAAEPPIPNLFDFWQARPTNWLPPFQAPPQLPTFVGRTNVVANVTRYLCSQAHRRICCLLGMAGLGKTSLATHLAYKLRNHFSDGVLWIRLGQINQMDALQAIAAAYESDVTIYRDMETRSSKVRELLATKNTLLIMDNADDDSDLRPLLPPDGNCAVLITSRRSDIATTDTAYRVHLTPFNEQSNESLALFSKILGKCQVKSERNPYQKIADRLGHLPLAINIIAQRLKHEPGWTAAQLWTRLQHNQQRLDLLTRGDQQVRLSISLSHSALSEADQRLFALLSIYPDSFTAVSTADILQMPLWDVEDSLRRLFNLSLLLQATSNRYRLHQLVSDFSYEQPQDPMWAQRFVQTFTAAAQTEAAWGEESDNIAAAIQLAHELGMSDEEITAITAYYPYLQQQGKFDQAIELLKPAEQTARETQNLAGLITILNQTGFTAMKQGHPDQAESYYEEALTLAKQTDNDEQTADILLKLGALAYRRSRLEEAQQFFTDGLALSRQLKNDRLIASMLTNLGLVEAAKGGLTAAISNYEEALPLARTINDTSLVIIILQNLGNMQEERGDYAQASIHFQEGLTLAKKQNDPELCSRMLGNLGMVACHLGNYAEATAYFRRGLALAEANGLSIQIYRQQANLGHVATLRGQHHQANTHYQESLALARELGFPEDLGMILNQAGESYLAQNSYKDATTCFTEAIQIANERQLQRVAPLSLFGLARVAAHRGNITEARRLGQQSREQLLTIGHNKANEVWWWLQELPGDNLPIQKAPRI